MADQPMPAAEFSRPVTAASLPHAGRLLDLRATDAECLALAARFGLPAIVSLSAALHARPRTDARIHVQGRIAATVVQICVVSLEPFETSLDVPYETMFVPHTKLGAAEEGLLDPDAIDEEGYEGLRIDLGESVSQALALALDPWPRRPGAVMPATQDRQEEAAPTAASPFAALARKPGK